MDVFLEGRRKLQNVRGDHMRGDRKDAQQCTTTLGELDIIHVEPCCAETILFHIFIILVLGRVLGTSGGPHAAMVEII